MKTYLERAEELKDFLHWNENDEELRDLAFKKAKKLIKEIEEKGCKERKVNYYPYKTDNGTHLGLCGIFYAGEKSYCEDCKKVIEKLNKIIGEKE